MVNIWRILRIALTSILVVIVILTLIFVADRYIFHPKLKGISLADIKDITIFLVTPLTVMIVVVRSIEKIKKERLPESKD